MSRFLLPASTYTCVKFLKLAEDGSTAHAINCGTVTKAQCLPMCLRDNCMDTVCVSLFLTDTLPTNILFVAHVALAAVACRCRDAASIQTQVGEMFADIDGVIHRHRA